VVSDSVNCHLGLDLVKHDDMAWGDVITVGDRRRRRYRGSWDDLVGEFEEGHDGETIGDDAAQEWSPDLTPVRPSTVVHGSHTLIPRYRL
jgi:hypothetical protein